MPEAAIVISVAAVVLGPAAGLGAALLGHRLGSRHFRHQVEETRWQRIQESFEKQIASAEKRGDEPKAAVLRQEYEGQLEAWRAQQDLEGVAPRTISARGMPTLKPQEVARLKELLAAAAPLSEGALSANDHLLRGNVLVEAGRHEEALAAYDRAVVLQPSFAKGHYNRGVALHELSRYQETVAAYDRALALEPDYAEALMNRGAALAEQGLYGEALASCDRALVLRPDHPVAHSNRGAVLTLLDRHQEVLAALDRALASLPDYAEAHDNRGVTLGRLGYREEALLEHDWALVLRPDLARGHYNRGVALYELSRYLEAIAAYDRSLALRPDHPRAHDGRGVALAHLGRHEEALAAHDRALNLRPGLASPLYNKACTLSLMEDGDSALEWLGRAIAADATNRVTARTDEDFAFLRDHPDYGPRFQELVGE